VGNLIECKDYDQLSLKACNILVEEVHKTLKRKELFCIAVPGGRSPRGLYRLMKDALLPWQRIRLFFTDERCLPPDSPESNYNLLKRLLLDHIPLPPENIYRIHGELPPEDAAADYERTLRDVLPGRGFDLLVLGLGRDCHIASLFPNSGALREEKRLAVAVYNTPVAPRVTITPPLIKGSERVMLLISGQEKKTAFKRLVHSSVSVAECPGKLASDHKNSVILYDRISSVKNKFTLFKPRQGAEEK